MIGKVLFLIVLVVGLGAPASARNRRTRSRSFFSTSARVTRCWSGRSKGGRRCIDAGGNGRIFDWLREYHVDSLDLVIATSAS